MATVDVRNVSTVVEIGPDAIVAEFTETDVTAQVMVGPTVVEFSWGELIPEPGLSGGGVFQGRVYIRPDIPTLPFHNEPIDPNADMIMVWDASRDEHVKRLAALGGGGGGADYLGDSLGTGAAVYKETDTAVAPRLHKFRSLVAGENIAIQQEPNEIIISAEGGSAPLRRPGSKYIGGFAQRCGSKTTSFTPSEISGIQAGDLVVWIVYFSYQGGTTSMPTTSGRVRFPSDWTPFLYETGNSHRAAFMAYKFITEDDLDVVFTANSVLSPIRTMCSHGHVFRNVHTQNPFGTPVTGNYQGAGNAKVICGKPLLHDDQHILQILSYRGGSGQSITIPPWSNRLGPESFANQLEGRILDSGQDIGSVFLDSYVWRASIRQDENWFGDETKYATLASSDWLYSQFARTQGPFDTRASLVSSGINSRHHAEHAVTLRAGEKYCFHVHAHANGSTGGYGIALSVTDPSSNERVAGFRASGGSTGTTGMFTINDPLADLGTTWIRDHWSLSGDGVPSSGGTWASIYFVAPEDGEYLLRVCGINASTADLAGLSFAGPGTGLSVSHVSFRSGWHSPAKIYTPDGPVMAGDLLSDRSTQASCVGYLTTLYSETPGGTSNTNLWAIPINPAWTKFPPARASDSYLDPPGLVTDVNDDGLSFVSNEYLGDDAKAGVRVNSMVWPKIDNEYQKYYFEIKADSYGSGNHYVYLTMPETSFSTEFMEGGNSYSYTFNPTATTDVVGVLIDYVAGNVKWYVNGSLQQTDTFPTTTYPTTGIKLRDRPLSIAVRLAESVSGNYVTHDCTLNLRGPFDYPQAADVLPFDHYGDPSIFSGGGIVQNTGDGLQIGINGPNGEFLLKSLSATDGVKLTDSPTKITASLNVPGLTALAAGSEDIAADYFIVYDASAALHKKQLLAALNPTTTKGDLIVRGTTALERVAVGTDGQVPIADSAVSAGIRWATLAGGGGVDLEQVVAQEADLVITSNATYQDTDLAVSLSAGTYIFEMDFIVSGHATPDLKMQVNYTGTVTSASSGSWRASNAGNAGSNYGTGMPFALTVLTATTDYVGRINGVIVVSDAGVLSLQIAQNTSSATAIAFRAGSLMKVRPV